MADPSFKAVIHPHPDEPLTPAAPAELEHEPHTPLADPPLADPPSTEPPKAPVRATKVAFDAFDTCPMPPLPSPIPKEPPNVGLGYIIPGEEILWLAGGAWLLGAITGALIAHSFSKGKVAQVCPMAA